MEKDFSSFRIIQDYSYYSYYSRLLFKIIIRIIHFRIIKDFIYFIL